MLRRPLIITTVLTILGLGSCQEPPYRHAVARIDGEKILAKDFREALAEEISIYDKEVFSNPEAVASIKKKVLDDIIHERLLLQEASTREIKIKSGELTNHLNKLQSGYDYREFDEILRKKKTTRREWEERQKRKLLIGKLTDQILDEKGPSEEEIQQIYKQNRSSFSEPERSHCRQIVASSRQKAEKILSLIEKGENFAAVAQKYSESPDREKGGDLGFVARGDLPPIMDEACFRFNAGQTSGVVQSAYGFHIFRVIEKRQPRLFPLKEAKSVIISEWRDKNRDEILAKWLEEKIKDAKIQIDENILSKTSLPL